METSQLESLLFTNDGAERFTRMVSGLPNLFAAPQRFRLVAARRRGFMIVGGDGFYVLSYTNPSCAAPQNFNGDGTSDFCGETRTTATRSWARLGAWPRSATSTTTDEATYCGRTRAARRWPHLLVRGRIDIVVETDRDSAEQLADNGGQLKTRRERFVGRGGMGYA